jgi:FtsZ-binding cell division protein ZapB
MTQSDLVALVTLYDTKLESLNEEVSSLSKVKDEAQNKAQEKDKYKQLARRLKEERNLYKDTVDDKL